MYLKYTAYVLPVRGKSREANDSFAAWIRGLSDASHKYKGGPMLVVDVILTFDGF